MKKVFRMLKLLRKIRKARAEPKVPVYEDVATLTLTGEDALELARCYDVFTDLENEGRSSCEAKIRLVQVIHNNFKAELEALVGKYEADVHFHNFSPRYGKFSFSVLVLKENEVWKNE